jgi:hypothetical protein
MIQQPEMNPFIENILQTLANNNLTSEAETIRQYQESLLQMIQSLQEEIAYFKALNRQILQKENEYFAIINRLLVQEEILINKLMNESTDKSQKINVGGDFNINATQSVVNLRDIIGDVNHTINQIPADTSPQNQELKTLLQELTEAIQIEATLDDDEKATAASQVKKIAQASQNPDDSALQTKAKKAVNLLETISQGLEPASKLFKACQKVLPLILGFLGI